MKIRRLRAPFGAPPTIEEYRLGNPTLRRPMTHDSRTAVANSERPLVSVVTVVYNGARTLERTIRSVVEQDYRPIEYVVIDGGSTDGSLDIIASYSDEIAYCISERDGGIYDAMNKGIAAASGEIIGLINSDDWYAAGAVSSIVELAKTSPDADILYGNAELRTPGRPNVLVRPPHALHASDFWHNPVPHPALFVTRACYERLGLYRTALKVLADYELLMRSYYAGARFAFVDELLAVAEAGGFSYQQRLTSAAESRYVLGQHNPRWDVRARMHLNIARLLAVWAAEDFAPLRIALRGYQSVKDRFRAHEA